MTTEPKTLDLDDTIRDAIVLMQTGRYRNVPLVDRRAPAGRRRPPVGHHQVPGGVVPRGAAQPAAATPPAHEGAGRRVTLTKELEPDIQELERVTIRFAGDSGDGMQLTGTQFTRTAAVFGNDISTLPDFPAEIRAPAGSLPGVSGFQISFSSSEIHTPGDQPDVLVAMNPAALKTNIGDLPAGGALIVNSDAFTQQNLNKAAYASNPLTDGSLKAYTVFEVPISTLNTALARGPRHDLEADGPDQELLRARADVLAVRAQHGPDDRLDRPEVRGTPGRRRGEQAGAQGRLRVRRDDRGVPHPLPGQAGQARPGRLPEHHRQRGDRARLPGRLASWPTASCSTARTRSRRPRTSSTSCRATRRSGSRRSRPRTRSRRSARPSARRTAGRSR